MKDSRFPMSSHDAPNEFVFHIRSIERKRQTTEKSITVKIIPSDCQRTFFTSAAVSLANNRPALV